MFYVEAKSSKIGFVQVGDSLKKRDVKFKINNFNDNKITKLII